MVAVEAQIGEHGTALLVGQVGDLHPVEADQVKGVVHDRHCGKQCFGRPVVVDALLQQREGGPVAGFKGDDLAVDDGASPAEQSGKLERLRIGAGDIVGVARIDPYLGSFKIRDRPDTVVHFVMIDAVDLGPPYGRRPLPREVTRGSGSSWCVLQNRARGDRCEVTIRPAR